MKTKLTSYKDDDADGFASGFQVMSKNCEIKICEFNYVNETYEVSRVIETINPKRYTCYNAELVYDNEDFNIFRFTDSNVLGVVTGDIDF